MLCGGFTAYQSTSNCECAQPATGVRQWAQTFIVKRETTQTCS